MSLNGKKAIVFGVANSRSLAWAIAENLHSQGVEVSIVCQSERLESKAKKLADKINAKTYICDVTIDGDLEKTFKEHGNTDYIIHSLAYAPTESVSAPLSEVKKEDFLKTFEVSVFSLIEMVGIGKKFLNPNGSVLTLTYIGSQRVMSGYNLMGVAKAALEAAVRYLSVELGENGHRINAISAGPIKTLSSSVFPSFNKVLDLVKERTPMHENITGEDVGNLASFLVSENSKMITGGVHYVDGGANIIGA